MQIKPHQIPHFARQIDRFKQIRESWDKDAMEGGTWFSRMGKVIWLIDGKEWEVYLEVN